MKKYIRHSDEYILYSTDDKICYVRNFKTKINNIDCFKDFTRWDYLKGIPIGKYKVIGTQKETFVKDGFITKVNYFLYIRDKLYKNRFGAVEETLYVNMDDLVYEKGFSLGRVLLFESIR